uniref:NADH-ubiquinone oxidoreductase chain 2 n=1 Tax=Apalone ferox TaxID=100213 RepID=D5G1R8_APAFE|nr:NADH dehydrogenase subunit 2 [Apalone ferox]ACO83386.1 NADH dehydrogenase subunit 2 [Apalone ferox]ARR28332.1 NADH dehydrogenase subunit 2 [Apalone ferox]
MNPNASMITISSLILGPMITITSNHWIMAWMGLEINMLAIIPLIAKQHHPRAIEAAIKYFLTQAAASSLLLFSIINNTWNLGQFNITQLSDTTSSTMVTIALSMKLGLSPFHYWLPETLQGTTTTMTLILTTWQKLAPLSLMVLINQSLNTPLLMLLGLLSMLIGGWGGLNQTQLRKMMAFSSIAHLGWMITILTLSTKLTLLTFYIYVIMTATMLLTIKLLETNKMSTAMTSWTKLPALSSTMMLNLMSLAGLPPLTGFMPKWLILQELTKNHMIIFATMAAILSLLSLFFYLRIAYYSTITLSPNMNNYSQQWRHKINQKPYLAPMIITSSLLTPIMPTLAMLM